MSQEVRVDSVGLEIDKDMMGKGEVVSCLMSALCESMGQV